jgi:hypothetical protein
MMTSDIFTAAIAADRHERFLAEAAAHRRARTAEAATPRPARRWTTVFSRERWAPRRACADGT